jgi:hypothetical protein
MGTMLGFPWAMTTTFAPFSPMTVPSQPNSLLSTRFVTHASTDAHTLDYKCGRRCTFSPLGGLTGQPVTLRSYTVHGYAGLAGTRLSKIL